jgi:hypothetical protein
VIHLFLFDVDGVLVETLAYLKALQDTVSHFSRQMGVGDHSPTEEEVEGFEANGLTSEWDSGPACVAALLLERLRREPSLPLPARWPDALAALAASPLAMPRPDYGLLARRVGQRLSEGGSPARAARAVLWDECQAIGGLESSRAAVAALLEALLGRTHDFFHAPVTRHFQHLAIGSQAVAETYGVAPDFESAAYLQRFDHPLLRPEVRDRLGEAARDGTVRVALYTARPSRPPDGVDGPLTGYSPEAEMAQSLVSLEPWPVIGRGKVRWLARQVGEDLEGLTKPSPVQALAAIGAAWSGQEVAALEAALALHRQGRLRPPLADLGPATVHVFEDSNGGLQAVARAVEALGAAGVPIVWQPYGIAPAKSAKAAALGAGDVAVYPSVNEAILAALARF